MAFSLVTVTGQWFKADNVTPATGSVDFKLTNDMADAAGNRILATTITKAVLNGSGSISVALAATDDTTTLPLGTLYEVTERIDGAPSRSFFISLPKTPNTFDLSDAVPFTSGLLGQPTLIPGPQGPAGPVGPPATIAPGTYVTGSVRLTVASTAPSSPAVNDVWVATS